MEHYQTIKEIIFLPKQFHERRNVSIYSLLKETSYFDVHDQINEDNIFEVLVQHPECVDMWLLWSEDKRTTEGWYFESSADKKFVVGYFPKKEIKTEYKDRTKACAVFIKNEIEDIRKI